MPLVENFTAEQQLGFPSRILFTDTSTGSDGAVTSRRIFLLDSNGDYSVEEGTTTTYEVWPYADSTITLDVMDEDKAFYITVQWLDVNNTVLYTKTELTVFRLYAITYYIYLIKTQSSNIKLREFGNFYKNLIRLLCSLQEAYDAVFYAGDILSAQAACDRAKELINNPSYFF